jgi:hypothetical protein
MSMTYSYMLYRLTINLPLPCDFLPPVENDTDPDVIVAYGSVPSELHDKRASDDTWEAGYCWQAAPGRYLLKGGNRSARFLVEGGNRVTVERNPAAEDDLLLFHLLHYAIAALFRQRGLLALHASAVTEAGGGIAICGNSQAGKTTTLAAMLQSGSEMISDDLTVLRFAAGGLVEVVPGPQRLHLWDEAAHTLAFDVPRLGRHPMRPGKAAVQAPEKLGQEPAPLRKIFVIEPSPEEDLSVLRLSGTEKFNALLECLYGPIFQEEHPGLFSIFSAAVRQADVFRIRRPEHRWSVREVVKVILEG